MFLCGVSVPGQDKRAGVSLCHRGLLVVQDVLDQAARCLLDVCVFLRKGIKEDTCKETVYLLATLVVLLYEL